MDKKKINVAIGFATGRKHFQRVLRSYVFNWLESELISDDNIGLNLFVAYDLEYRGTKKTDYTVLDHKVGQWLDSTHFIGKEETERVRHSLLEDGIIDQHEADMLFSRGYASQRNIILYYAIKNKMDYLLFLDDDEYPMAVTRNGDTAIWSGQHVLKTHLQHIKNAYISYGYHCGYVSPIPHIEFSDKLTEESFRLFIEAISNDIVNWGNIKRIMNNGGVTYADTDVLVNQDIFEVPEVHHAKFISGSNLCINLTEPGNVLPFYNPPGARGEDTFLSTCLNERKVLRVPCYAFHDGFSSYNHLLSGVLPTRLKFIKPDSEHIIKRFYNACIGWVRYKPLYLYITDPKGYKERIADMNDKLKHTLPFICSYFGIKDFMNISRELEKYSAATKKHYDGFIETKRIWSKILMNLLGAGGLDRLDGRLRYYE